MLPRSCNFFSKRQETLTIVVLYSVEECAIKGEPTQFIKKEQELNDANFRKKAKESDLFSQVTENNCWKRSRVAVFFANINSSHRYIEKKSKHFPHHFTKFNMKWGGESKFLEIS